MSPARAAIPEPLQYPLLWSDILMSDLGMPRADAPPTKGAEKIIPEDSEMSDVKAGQPALEKEDQQSANNTGADPKISKPPKQHTAQPEE